MTFRSIDIFTFGQYEIQIVGFFVFSTTTEPYDTDMMAQEFVQQFPYQALTVGQQLDFNFVDKKFLLSIIVKELEGKLNTFTIQKSL